MSYLIKQHLSSLGRHPLIESVIRVRWHLQIRRLEMRDAASLQRSASNGLLTMTPVCSGRARITQRAARWATRHLCVCSPLSVCVNLRPLARSLGCSPLFMQTCPQGEILTARPPLTPLHFLPHLARSWCQPKKKKDPHLCSRPLTHSPLPLAFCLFFFFFLLCIPELHRCSSEWTCKL